MGWTGKRGEYGAEAVGRWVGISLFAFCADCGQPRKLLRSSSGAKSRGASHLPASSPDDFMLRARERQRGDTADRAESDDDDVGLLKVDGHGRLPSLLRRSWQR